MTTSTDTSTDTKDIATFVAVSSILTGIAKGKLAPLLDPKDVKTIYYEYAVGQDPAMMQKLLSLFDAKEKPAVIAEAIFNSDAAWFARSVMLEWYLGAWYSPEQLEQYQKDNSKVPSGTILSAATYTSGWAWSVAQAHPMGSSTLRFGYWAGDPPTLEDYVGSES